MESLNATNATIKRIIEKCNPITLEEVRLPVLKIPDETAKEVLIGIATKCQNLKKLWVISHGLCT